MHGKRCLLTITLLLVASSTLMAQPGIVNIQLQPGTPRTIEVTPRVDAVCRKTPNCPTKIDFRWIGAAGSDPSERILVEYKYGLFFGEDGTPSQTAPETCFTFPGDANPFELQHGPANERTLLFKEDAEGCPDKVVFFFDISCQNEAKDNCGGIATLDPATMVDNGG